MCRHASASARQGATLGELGQLAELLQPMRIHGATQGTPSLLTMNSM
jgi:hypothetical protein